MTEQAPAGVTVADAGGEESRRYPPSVTHLCEMCGRSVASHSRHVRFRLPDPVLRLPEQERTPGTWMSHGDAAGSVMMQVPNVGPVRPRAAAGEAHRW
jgi:hypothetical protein